MTRTILITGATDGIGLETARMLVAKGHLVLIHGRNPAKLEATEKLLSEIPGGRETVNYLADLSNMDEVEALAKAVSENHERLDVLINNAGIFRTPNPVTRDGLDVRFAVNTIAPWLLTQRLLPLMNSDGRVVNLSSAAQSTVNPDALTGNIRLADEMDAYAQSKLAITSWSRHLALELGEAGPAVIAVNPGSLLGSKMVKEGFGVAGGDIRIGADILVRAALSDEFANASGRYFDNDSGRFAQPHPSALDTHQSGRLISLIREIVG